MEKKGQDVTDLKGVFDNLTIKNYDDFVKQLIPVFNNDPFYKYFTQFFVSWDQSFIYTTYICIEWLLQISSTRLDGENNAVKELAQEFDHVVRSQKNTVICAELILASLDFLPVPVVPSMRDPDIGFMKQEVKKRLDMNLCMLRCLKSLQRKSKELDLSDELVDQNLDDIKKGLLVCRDVVKNFVSENPCKFVDKGDKPPLAPGLSSNKEYCEVLHRIILFSVKGYSSFLNEKNISSLRDIFHNKSYRYMILFCSKMFWASSKVPSVKYLHDRTSFIKSIRALCGTMDFTWILAEDITIRNGGLGAVAYNKLGKVRNDIALSFSKTGTRIHHLSILDRDPRQGLSEVISLQSKAVYCLKLLSVILSYAELPEKGSGRKKGLKIKREISAKLEAGEKVTMYLKTIQELFSQRTVGDKQQVEKLKLMIDGALKTFLDFII